MSCWVVSKKDAGQSLRQFLRDRVSGASLRQIKCAIDQGLVDINGRSESVSTKVLRLGDNICFHSESLAAKEEVAKGFDVDRIIFEDEYLLAYNKPPMVTSTDKGGLLSILRKHYPGLQALHRLDKDTSGVLLFAKKTVAAEGLLLQFKEREILKVYWAIVDGVPIRKSGSVSNYLGQRRTLQGKVVWGVVEPEYGGLAKTEWHVIKHGRKAALVECKPKTGRTHQQ